MQHKTAFPPSWSAAPSRGWGGGAASGGATGSVLTLAASDEDESTDRDSVGDASRVGVESLGGTDAEAVGVRFSGSTRGDTGANGVVDG